MAMTSESWKTEEQQKISGSGFQNKGEASAVSPLSCAPGVGGVLVSSCLVGVDRSHI